MVRETAAYLKRSRLQKARHYGDNRHGAHGLISDRADREAGLSYVLPNDEMQQNVMSLIYDCVKAGEPADMVKFRAVSDALRADGCDAIILGCTELSIIKRDNELGPVISMRWKCWHVRAF